MIINRRIVTSLLVACTLFSAISCTKKNEKELNVEIVESIESLINDEIFENLKRGTNFWTLFSLMKDNEFKFDKNKLIPEQYTANSDRRNQAVKLGMLTVDTAFLRLADGRTQTPEYDELIDRYAKDLGISSLINSYLNDTVSLLTEIELSKENFDVLAEKFNQSRVSFYEKMRGLDDELLIHFTIGTSIEILYILRCTDIQLSAELREQLAQYLGGKSERWGSFSFAIMERDSDNKVLSKELVNQLKNIRDIFANSGEVYPNISPENWEKVDKAILTMRDYVL